MNYGSSFFSTVVISVALAERKLCSRFGFGNTELQWKALS